MTVRTVMGLATHCFAGHVRSMMKSTCIQVMLEKTMLFQFNLHVHVSSL